MADPKEQIGDYRLRSLLQTSHATQVFEVVEVKSNRHFAMKLLLPEHVGNANHRNALFNEAEIGVKMRHENVINIYKVSRSPTTPHFIMEYFPSGSLRTRLMSRDPKDKEFLKTNARSIFRQIATGLAYMNSSGYIHRDIKPDNVLVNAACQTKIIDFAISRKVPSGLSALFYRRKRPQGTRSYMSPEQIRDEKPQPCMDIYSYGCMVYELTTGRPPFRGNSENDLLQKHFIEKPVTPVAYNTDLTDEFGKFCLKLLAKKKDERPKSFHEVLQELKKTRIFKSIDDSEEQA